MTVNDLMVGDWVYVKDYPTIKNIQRIRPEHFVRSLVDIEPIPLTPEVLEKNGFRIIFEGELHTTYFQDIEGFHVEIKIDCINYIRLSMLNGLGYNITIECNYVHELQHALRLCGIDEELKI